MCVRVVVVCVCVFVCVSVFHLAWERFDLPAPRHTPVR